MIYSLLPEPAPPAEPSADAPADAQPASPFEPQAQPADPPPLQSATQLPPAQPPQFSHEGAAACATPVSIKTLPTFPENGLGMFEKRIEANRMKNPLTRRTIFQKLLSVCRVTRVMAMQL